MTTMTTTLKLRKGFSFDEAIIMTTLSKYAYEIFVRDDGSIDDSELKTLYQALYKNKGWELVHSVRNDETNIRALILKNPQSHQYVISFRGTAMASGGAVNLTDSATDVDWLLIPYGALSNQKAKVVKGFHLAFESVADEIQCFFRTLQGKLQPTDLRYLHNLPPLRKFACITAMTDAAGILLGTDFQQEAQDLIAKVIADGEVDNDEELENVFQFIEQQTLPKQTPSTEPIEVWTTGHSLGGSLCQLAALALRRWFGSVEDGGLLIKVYAIAGCKIGNQAFVDFYNQQIGAELSYRIENTLDIIPNIPVNPPLPISAIAPQGIQLGNLFIGEYANGGEAIIVTGFGGQPSSISFGGLFDIPFTVPFPHSPDTYIQLLREQELFWYQWSRPVKDTLRPFLIELLDEDQKKGVSAN
ncbi:hypothetical protein IQ227_04550 [Anabaena aphanizomenioides LEGE 00250]|uniref:Fungal lipase-type domain-containing protein n=1 Tax=Sphaerospermopsis aphanizomenoides LEGE 00250 TaxID=2777972 RepID=A0ABR9VA11_9CYAN|nr:hypothetical protein [Sphaerospermopsis aphanizomenoides]MBE9235327.1 hypothetical protein [Sphaerospermopsis aphanizomenoides LEGE 00250]